MRALGIILAGGNNNKMRELSNKRAVAAMPVAGSFRSIDFALSSMANSHIQKVAVLTQYNARSLNEHLSSSKWWDFGRKHGGLFVFSPTVTSDNSWWYRGTADAISQNLSWLKNSHEPYVVIASGDGVYKLDFNKVLEYHIAKRADVTVVCTDSKEADTSRFGVLKMNEDCRIEEFEEKPMVSSSNVIEQERKEMELLAQNNITFIVLARYMQVISEQMISAYPNKIINIHHSFLPAFVGARPYHAAFERGVKIIGATSHYVTTELDAGPIIEQDVVRITHKDSIEDLVNKGKDLEKIVLSRAVQKHIERKVLAYKNKTVIFN